MGADDRRKAITVMDELAEVVDVRTRRVTNHYARSQVHDFCAVFFISSGAYSTFPPGQPSHVV